MTTTGLYRWEETRTVTPLVHRMDSLPAVVVHCDYLVLMVTMSSVLVLTHGTRCVLTLPGSPGVGAARNCWVS